MYPEALYLLVQIVIIAVRSVGRNYYKASVGANEVVSVGSYAQSAGYNVKEIPIVSSGKICGPVFVGGGCNSRAVYHEGICVASSVASVVMQIGVIRIGEKIQRKHNFYLKKGTEFQSLLFL